MRRARRARRARRSARGKGGERGEEGADRVCTQRRVWAESAERREWELNRREIRVLHPYPPQPKLKPNLTLT